jgi:hypothetical protein
MEVLHIGQYVLDGGGAGRAKAGLDPVERDGRRRELAARAAMGIVAPSVDPAFALHGLVPLSCL